LAFGAAILAYLALPISEAFFIVKASANIPISDTWGYVSILTKFATTGHVAWSHIFRFYGDGRPALERFGLLIDAKYFGLNVQIVKLLSVLVGVLETLCAIWAFRVAMARSHWLVVLIAAYPAALVIFCWNSWQNLLDEWNLMNLAAVALFFLALLLIVTLRHVEHKKPYLLLAAVLVCAIASFTGEAGTLSWVACGIVLWLPASRCRLRDKIVFSAIGLAFLGLYFSGAKKVAKGHPLSHLGRVVDFALVCLGNGVIGGGDRQLGLARAIGVGEIVVIVILAGAYITRKNLKGDRAVEFAAGLAAFGVMGALATGVSRIQLGLGTAMSSRYLVLSAPVAIGIYLALTRLVTLRDADGHALTTGSRRALLFALPCLLAASVSVLAIVGDVSEGRGASAKRAYYVALKQMACDPAAYTNKQLSRFDHSGGLKARQKKQLLAQIADLKQAKLSVFSGGVCKAYAHASASAPEPSANRST
jgi:hypothetical protein